MKTDNLEFYQTDVQGELEIWKDKNTDNVFYVPVKIIRDFDNLSVCNINKWDGIKKWARCCSVTGKGMNNGWIWGDGDFYVKNQDDAMNECWKDRYDIREELFTYIDNMKLDNISKKFKSETINKIDTIVNWFQDVSFESYTDEDVQYDKFTDRLPSLDNLVSPFEVDTLLKIFKKMVSLTESQELLKDDYFFLANMLDNMYYTEWECEDDYQYVEIDGKLICYDEHE